MARTRLEWEPKVALDDGLRETIAYFRKLLAS
jgi:UDP-glucuronate decarboxylase